MQRILSRAPLTARLCVVLLASFLLSAFVPRYASTFALTPCRSGLGAALPPLLLYWLIFGSLFHWLITCFSLVCSALVCERELGAVPIVILCLGTTVLGATAFLLTTSNCVPFVGPAAFTWGFAGAALIAVIFRWKLSHWLERAYVIVVLLSFATLVQAPAAVVALQLTGFLFGAALALLRFRQRRAKVSSGTGVAA